MIIYLITIVFCSTLIARCWDCRLITSRSYARFSDASVYIWLLFETPAIQTLHRQSYDSKEVGLDLLHILHLRLHLPLHWRCMGFAGCWLVCSAFQVPRRWDHHQLMPCTWARWSAHIPMSAATRSLTPFTLSVRTPRRGCASPVTFCFRMLTHTHMHPHMPSPLIFDLYPFCRIM